MADIFATKFLHWSYEEEVRLLTEFETKIENEKICFYPYSDELQLRQIIMGRHSKFFVEEILEVVGNGNVEVFQSRLAFKSFAVVRQENKKRWNWRKKPSEPTANEPLAKTAK